MSLGQVTAVSAAVPAAMIDAVLDALAATPFTPTSWEDAEKHVCRVELFLEDNAAAAAAAETLRRVGDAFGLDLAPETAILPAANWAESWKRFFRVTHVTPRVVVRPAWEDYRAAPGEVVIDIEPGLSFGTGNHGTTRACLTLLDRIAAEAAGRSLLDMGCGSGILAIGGAKLGYKPVRGFDNDPDAVMIARENARLNGVAVEFAHCELAGNSARADVVVANILAPVLMEYAGVIAAAVNAAPRGMLVVSGILDEQYAAVLAAFARFGFAERESLKIDEWRSGWLVCR